MGNFFFKGPPRIDKPLFVQVGQKNDSYSNGSIPIKHRRLVGFYESSGGTSNNFLVQPLRPGGFSIPGDRNYNKPLSGTLTNQCIYIYTYIIA